LVLTAWDHPAEKLGTRKRLPGLLALEVNPGEAQPAAKKGNRLGRGWGARILLNLMGKGRRKNYARPSGRANGLTRIMSSLFRSGGPEMRRTERACPKGTLPTTFERKSGRGKG